MSNTYIIAQSKLTVKEFNNLTPEEFKNVNSMYLKDYTNPSFGNLEIAKHVFALEVMKLEDKNPKQEFVLLLVKEVDNGDLTLVSWHAFDSLN